MDALLAAAASTAILMAMTWAVARHLSDASVVDVTWGLAFVVIAWLAWRFAEVHGTAQALVAVMVTMWGVRLSAHVALRKRREPGEDRRYTEILGTGRRRLVLAVFAPQALLILLVALPLIFPAGERPGWIAVIGVALWLVGFALESIGDAQLARFKSDPANRGKVLDRGLWRFTRHPNYFGDCCVWWGLWLAGGRWWTAAGPLVMTFLLVRGSGKRLLERDISARRPGYADYVRRTSGFLPLPPRSVRP